MSDKTPPADWKHVSMSYEDALARITDGLKKEGFGIITEIDVTGTFKARGAYNRLLGARPPDSGVIAASGGNHGIAVAYATSLL